MGDAVVWSWVWFGVGWSIRLGLSAWVIMRRPAVPVALAWVALVMALPFVAVVAYALIGNNRLGRRRLRSFDRVDRELERRASTFWKVLEADWEKESEPFRHVARLAGAVGGMPPLVGNTIRIIGDTDEFLAAIVADIDRAEKFCHLLFYIFEGKAADQVGEALIRAAGRGVECRLLVDGVGSRPFVRCDLCERMRGAGVRVVGALEVGLWRAMLERIDLRNHRKIVVIDGRVGYVGSHNINDAASGIKLRFGRGFARWVDASVRLEGPAVGELEVVFLRDWITDSEEAMEPLERYLPTYDWPREGSLVQVVPSGPGMDGATVRETLVATIHSAREEIIMTTPYFVPDEATKSALAAAAMSGVSVALVVPHTIDTMLTAAAGRSHFEELMRAGVKIMRYKPGLLHAKTVTVDRAMGLIGSTNFDMRSFFLNFEITLFVYDSDVTGLLRMLQTSYMADSEELFVDSWVKRPLWKRAVENAARLLGPLL